MGMYYMQVIYVIDLYANKEGKERTVNPESETSMFDLQADDYNCYMQHTLTVEYCK